MPTCRFATAAPEEKFVFGACEPGWHHQAPNIDSWIDFMQNHGIDRVCCLLSDVQVDEHDNLIEQYENQFGTESVLHASVMDHTLIPESTFTDKIIPFIEQSVSNDERVVVHCKAGIGRTGQVLAGWLVYEHCYTPEEAIGTVKNRHRTPDDAVRTGNATESELINRLSKLKR